MKSALFYFILASFINFFSAKVLIKSGLEMYEVIAHVAVEIINKYFINHKCIVIVSDNEGLKLRLVNISSTVVLFFYRKKELERELDKVLLETFKANCRGYIIQSSRPTEVIKSWSRVSETSINRHSPEIVFLPTNPNEVDLCQEIFSMKEAGFISHLVVSEFSNFTSHDDKAVLNFFTNDFYVRGKGKLFLGQWSSKNGFEKELDLFIDKIKDLKGKEVRFATWTYPPYDILEPLDGTEARIILQFCAKHNCTVKTTTDEFMWGYIYDNGTGNGVMGRVYLGLADFGASGLYLWSREYMYLEYSTPYLYSSVVCLVPKPALLPEWLIPILPFEPNLWVGVLVSLLLAVVSLYLITKIQIKYTRFGDKVRRRGQFLSVTDCGLRVAALAVLQTPSRLVINSPIRHLFTFTELMFLLITSCYSAALSSYLTVPTYYPPLNTIKEFLTSGMYWLADHEAWVYSLTDVPDPEIQLLASRFQVDSHANLLKKALTGKYGVTVEKLPAGYSPEEPHLTLEVISNSHMMKESFYGAPTMVVMQKGSAYAPALNKLIYNILDAGLLLFWEGEVARRFLSVRKQQALGLSRRGALHSEPKPLKIKHTQGAFFLLVLGLLLASFIFIGELLIRPSNKNG